VVVVCGQQRKQNFEHKKKLNVKRESNINMVCQVQQQCMMVANKKTSWLAPGQRQTAVGENISRVASEKTV
jgi:hypothetical protein